MTVSRRSSRRIRPGAAALSEAVTGGAVALAVCGGYQLLGRYYRDRSGSQQAPAPASSRCTRWPETKVDRRRPDRMRARPRRRRPSSASRITPAGRSSSRAQRRSAGSWPAERRMSGFEGCRLGTIGTYLHGPLLPRNPWLADWLLARAVQHRFGELPVFEPLMDTIEERGARRREGPCSFSRGRPPLTSRHAVQAGSARRLTDRPGTTPGYGEIERIAADADSAYDPQALWPAEEWDFLADADAAQGACRRSRCRLGAGRTRAPRPCPEQARLSPGGSSRPRSVAGRAGLHARRRKLLPCSRSIPLRRGGASSASPGSWHRTTRSPTRCSSA